MKNYQDFDKRKINWLLVLNIMKDLLQCWLARKTLIKDSQNFVGFFFIRATTAKVLLSDDYIQRLKKNQKSDAGLLYIAH